MSTANTSAVNYTVPPNLKGSGAKNGSGSATRIGSTTLLSNVSVSKDTTGVFGSVVVDGTDADKAVSGGTFAHNHVKPIAARVTNEIAGVTSSVLGTTSNNPAQLRSINKRESYKSSGVATAIRAGYFNLYTGKFSPAPTPVSEAPGNDVAANPTRSAPGDIVFRTGAKLPVTSYDYKAKTG